MAEIKIDVDSAEFCKQITSSLSKGKVWRTAKSLAEETNLDEADVQGWLGKQTFIMIRPSKEEGVYYFALGERINTPKKEDSKEVKFDAPSLYAAYIHFNFLCVNYRKVLSKYALDIGKRDTDLLKIFTSSLDDLETASAILASKLKFDAKILPEL